MKREMELVRTILLEVEAHPDLTPVTLQAPGYTPDQVAHHVKLLYQAGLIDATETTSLSGMSWIVNSLTWHGYEFLDAARNEKVWRKLTEELKNRGMSLPFELIQKLVLKIAAEYMGLQP
jgi:hypothetical protein